MQEQDDLYEYCRSTMAEIMAVLYANGCTELHVGAMMRLLGVDNERASLHDEERMEIDQSFLEIASELNIVHLLRSRVPAGVIIH